MTEEIEAKTEPESAATALGSRNPAEAPWRRWHRLVGGVILGAFVVVHLFVQGSAVFGARAYDAIALPLSRSPVVSFILLTFVGLPLVFHAAYGIALLRSPDRSAVTPERYGSRREVTAQRVSAVVVALFVAVHLWDFWLSRLFFGLSSEALLTKLTARLSWTAVGIPWIALFYVAGIFAVALHLSGGLFAATAAWNVATGPAGRKNARRVTVGLGATIFLLGATIVVCLATGTRLVARGNATSGPPCGSDVQPKAPGSPSPSR